MQLGRYWTKEERKQQILERHRKVHNHFIDINCKNCAKLRCQHANFEPSTILIPHGSNIKKSPKQIPPNLIIPNPPSVIPKKPPVAPSDKKSLRKKSHKESITEDFKTVQEMIVSGSRPPTSSTTKMIGLLSVTTV